MKQWDLVWQMRDGDEELHLFAWSGSKAKPCEISHLAVLSASL